jgi:hypothetical protein
MSRPLRAASGGLRPAWTSPPRRDQRLGREDGHRVGWHVKVRHLSVWRYPSLVENRTHHKVFVSRRHPSTGRRLARFRWPRLRCDNHATLRRAGRCLSGASRGGRSSCPRRSIVPRQRPNSLRPRLVVRMPVESSTCFTVTAEVSNAALRVTAGLLVPASR